MVQQTIDILGLNQGTPKGSDEYPAVDTKDFTQSLIGSTKKYLLADLYSFFVTNLGFTVLPATSVASTANYIATYNNGIGGVNATLTDATGTFSTFTIDGIPGVRGTTPYLIKNQTNQIENGIYYLTQNGDGISQPWILIRVFYFNSNANIINGEITMVTGGLTQANTVWQLTAPSVVVVGTSNLTFAPFKLFSAFVPLPIPPQYGGTGIANLPTSTITLAGSLQTIGAFPAIFNFSGPTNVLFPTSGTLLSSTNYPVPGAPTGSIIISDGVNWIASTSLWPNTVGNVGKLLRSNGTTNVYSTAVFADTYGASEILYSNGINNIQGLTTSANGTLITSALGVPSISSTLPNAVQDNITRLGTITSITTPLGTPFGGTGLNAPTIHNLLIGNGIGALTLLPPSATSGIPLISQGVLANPAYGTAVVAGGGTGNTTFTAFSVICAGITATGAFQNVVGLGAIGNVLTSAGPGALPVWAAPAASGTVNPGLINEIAYYAAPGTAVSPISPTQINGLLVTSNTGVPSILAGPGTANHVLMSNAAAAPAWSVPTYPNASVTAGKVIISDGTNYIASTPTYPNASAIAGKMIISDGTNFIASTSIWPNTVGALGKIIISDGTNNVYSTPAYPNASVAAGKIIISDGTNYIASTPTYPNASVTAGKLIISDGTNYIASTSIWPNTVGTSGKIIQSDGTSNVYSTPTYPLTAGTLGNVLTSDGTNWQSLPNILLSGFIVWGGAGPYFDDTTLGSFTLLRPGSGYCANKYVSWTAPQTIAGLTAGTTWLIYIDNTGTIQKASSDSSALYEANILLFACLRDSTSPTNHQLTVKENHSGFYPAKVTSWADDVIGSVLSVRDTGGTIALNGTVKIQINGANKIYDNSNITNIPDSGGVAVSWYQYFTLAGGAWARYTQSDTFGAFYNAGGTVTALGGNKYAVYTLYVAKDNLNSVAPIFIAVLDTSEYNTAALALNAINNGTTAKVTNELFNLEVAQLGYIIFSQSTGTIVNVIVAKGVIGSGFITGGTTVSTVQFNALVGGPSNTIVSVAPSATSGIPFISQGVAANPIFGTAVVAGGGTGNTTFTAYSVICAGTTATGPFQNVSGLGLAGQVLTSAGPAALPTWQNAAGTGTVNSGTAGELAYYAASTNAVSGNPNATISTGTLTLGVATSVLGSLVLSGNTSGTVTIKPQAAAGGYNFNLPITSGNAGQILQSGGGGATAMTWSTPTYPSTSGTAGKILRSDGTNNVYSTSTFADTYAASTLLYSNGANTVQGLATAASSILVTDGSSVPSWSTTIPAFTTTTITFNPTTGGIVGTTTNDNAGAGKVGELISNIISTPQPILNNTNTDIGSITLTAGDWDVWGSIQFQAAASTIATLFQAWSHSVSATLPASLYSSQITLTYPAGGAYGTPIPYRRYSLSTTTTIYLEAYALFTVSTMTCFGTIFARRAR